MENKRIRQYIGLVAAVLSYYLIHEGAHLITALFMGVFKEVKFLGFGMQIDVAVAQMTDLQMGIFCLAGAVCTWIAAVLLTLLEHAGTVCVETSLYVLFSERKVHCKVSKITLK